MSNSLPFTAKKAAIFVIAFLDSKGDLITNKKLQKLLYYIQAWHLAIFDHKLFDEQPEAWVHGPVYRSVYNKYKNFQYDPVSIKEIYEKKSMNSDQLVEYLSAKYFSQEQLKLTIEVIQKYGRKSAFELEMMTHSEKPWLEMRKGLEDHEYGSQFISFETMKDYYASLLKK